MPLIEHCPVVGSSDGAPGGRACEASKVNLKCVVGNDAQKKLFLTPAGRTSPPTPHNRSKVAQLHRDTVSGLSKSVKFVCCFIDVCLGTKTSTHFATSANL